MHKRVLLISKAAFCMAIMASAGFSSDVRGAPRETSTAAHSFCAELRRSTQMHRQRLRPERTMQVWQPASGDGLPSLCVPKRPSMRG